MHILSLNQRDNFRIKIVGIGGYPSRMWYGILAQRNIHFSRWGSFWNTFGVERWSIHNRMVIIQQRKWGAAIFLLKASEKHHSTVIFSSSMPVSMREMERMSSSMWPRPRCYDLHIDEDESGAHGVHFYYGRPRFSSHCPKYRMHLWWYSDTNYPYECHVKGKWHFKCSAADVSSLLVLLKSNKGAFAITLNQFYLYMRHTPSHSVED